MTALQAAALWTGLLILWLVFLSLRVVIGRRKHKVMFGEGGDQAMTLLSRGFGNAAEYAPLAIGALILLALLDSPAWVVHAIGGAFLLGRLVHPFGLVGKNGPGAGRVLGMTLTWLPLIAAGVMLIIAAV